MKRGWNKTIFLGFSRKNHVCQPLIRSTQCIRIKATEVLGENYVYLYPRESVSILGQNLATVETLQKDCFLFSKLRCFFSMEKYSTHSAATPLTSLKSLNMSKRQDFTKRISDIFENKNRIALLFTYSHMKLIR